MLLLRSDYFIIEYVKNDFCNMHAMNHRAPKTERSRSVERYEIFCKKVFNTFFHECLSVRNKFVGISVSMFY